MRLTSKSDAKSLLGWYRRERDRLSNEREELYREMREFHRQYGIRYPHQSIFMNRLRTNERRSYEVGQVIRDLEVTVGEKTEQEIQAQEERTRKRAELSMMTYEDEEREEGLGVVLYGRLYCEEFPDQCNMPGERRTS